MIAAFFQKNKVRKRDFWLENSAVCQSIVDTFTPDGNTRSVVASTNSIDATKTITSYGRSQRRRGVRLPPFLIYRRMSFPPLRPFPKRKRRLTVTVKRRRLPLVIGSIINMIRRSHSLLKQVSNVGRSVTAITKTRPKIPPVGQITQIPRPRRLPSGSVRSLASLSHDPNVIELDTFWTRIQHCLNDGDVRKSKEPYQELKVAARHQQSSSRSLDRDDLKWRNIREDLLQAWIDRTKDESLDTASLIEAASQAHMILEDLDERFSLYALSIPPKGENNTDELVKEALDDVPPLESTMIFTASLEVLQAWARACHGFRFDAQTKQDHNLQRMSRGIPQRAQFLLQQLERHSSKDLPLPYYEAVLQTWACSNEHLRGVQAEKVFQRISPSAWSPKAFHWIIRAWAWSRDPRAAFTATGHLMKRLRYHSNDTDDEMEPSLEDYEIVFDAWIRAEDKMAPTKALSLWTLWKNSIDEGITTVRPSLSVYRSLLLTATNRPNQPDLGHRLVDVLLSAMREELIIPDRACFESAICVWKNCALHPEVPDDRQACLRRINALLADLRSAHLRSTVDGTKGVTTKALNYVLESIQVSEHSQRAALAETLLKEMEESLVKGAHQAAPNPDSYRFVVDVYRTIPSRDRIPLAKTILLRCKDYILRSDVHYSARKAAVEVLNSFVHVCATTPQPVASEEGVSILREALQAVERFRSECGVVPNQSTYTYLLQAAKELVKKEASRSKIVDQVFRLACQGGMVDDVLLKQFMEVTTPDQYQTLVITPSEIVEGVRIIPVSWSRNALGGRVVSADGRRVRPLTVDGHLTVTKAMQDFKMRRLRDKRNQKLLRGGRWDRSLDQD